LKELCKTFKKFAHLFIKSLV